MFLRLLFIPTPPLPSRPIICDQGRRCVLRYNASRNFFRVNCDRAWTLSIGNRHARSSHSPGLWAAIDSDTVSSFHLSCDSSRDGEYICMGRLERLWIKRIDDLNIGGRVIYYHENTTKRGKERTLWKVLNNESSCWKAWYRSWSSSVIGKIKMAIECPRWDRIKNCQ